MDYRISADLQRPVGHYQAHCPTGLGWSELITLIYEITGGQVRDKVSKYVKK